MSHSGYINLMGRFGPIAAVQGHTDVLRRAGYEVLLRKTRVVARCSGFETEAHLGATREELESNLRSIAKQRMLLTYTGQYQLGRQGRVYSGLDLIKVLTEMGLSSFTALIVHPHKKAL